MSIDEWLSWVNFWSIYATFESRAKCKRHRYRLLISGGNYWSAVSFINPLVTITVPNVLMSCTNLQCHLPIRCCQLLIRGRRKNKNGQNTPFCPIIYSWFHIKGTWSVQSFNRDYLSIPKGTGSCGYLFHEIPGR